MMHVGNTVCGDWVLTAHHHHSHGENLLAICCWSNVTKSNCGQASHGEVERRNVQRVFGRTSFPPAITASVVAVRSSNTQCQLVEPAVCLNGVGGLINDLVVTNAVPNAGKPVSHQAEDTHQQDQDRSSILQVVVQFSGYAAQTEQADDFKGTEEAAETLQRKKVKM